jgi:hypothetical protein
MQRSFSVWLAEVKGLPVDSAGSNKAEVRRLFEEYREDYNTATLPHPKFYDYDKWEMEEYERGKSRRADASGGDSAGMGGGGGSCAQDDEAAHRQLLRKRAAEREAEAQRQLLAGFDPSKIRDMRAQADLRAQMQHAFKVGDKETYRRLKDRLAAPDP